MLIRLFNKSGLADEAVLPVLQDAARLIGVRGPVAVKVTRGGFLVRSSAHAGWPYRWHMDRHCPKEKRMAMVDTTGGWIEMQPRHSLDPLRMAGEFFETALHEFAHVLDFQTGFLPWSRRGPSGRRPAWQNRPEEIRAENAKDAALEKIKKNRLRIDDHILTLAVEIEGKGNWGIQATTGR